MVKHYHHVHFGHSHSNIFEEMGRGFLGIASQVVVGEPNAANGRAPLLRVGNLSSGRWYDGPLCDIGFLPFEVEIGKEFVNPPP